jgi:hypothetical protein
MNGPTQNMHVLSDLFLQLELGPLTNSKIDGSALEF